MGLIAFTRNYTDHSNNTGYQFEFFCDRCGNGYRSSFQASKIGMAGGLLRAAGSLFGGNLWQAAQAGDYVKDTLRGKAHDEAFARAVEEAKPHFKQCSRCGKWVCPEHCWNARRGLCEECAPNLEEEAAAAQAQAAKEQVWKKSSETDQVRGEIDVEKVEQSAACPHCGDATQGAKFCPDCGKPLRQKATCPSCKTQMEANTKFCPECGQKMV